jgi:alpha-mannosidase
MPNIDTIYLISHTHTDIGYTDHQDAVFRQHLAFIDQAIELGEATTDYPEESRYKWTCEVTSFVERYFRERPARQIDRFLALHQRGQMAVAAMHYHWTPMLSPAAMIRSLLPVMRLRRDYNLTITTAMQCDVNGAAWLWADLLPAIGVDSFTMSINMHRGRRPAPDLNAFWWQGPGGGRLLTYNGPHYLYGLFRYGIGDESQVEAMLYPWLERLTAQPDYPYDFLYAQVTHPARVDNGPPLPHLSNFVRRWNEAGRSPRMRFVTVDGFTRMLHERYGKDLVTWQGDWADWWADGVASSAYETGLNRQTEELLPLLDLLATQVDDLPPDLVEEAYHLVSLYDEHTWGSYASIRRPHAPFTRANWNRKASFAYDGYGLTHDLLAQGGRQLARQITGVTPEGDAWRRWGQYISMDPSVDPTAHRFLVVNPTPWQRQIRWPLPPDIGGAAPYADLEMFLVDNYREPSPLVTTAPPGMMIDVSLPGFGYEVIGHSQVSAAETTRVGEGVIENRWYRVEIDPGTGGIRSWFDKEVGRELATQDGPWRSGQYIYETVDHPDDRRAIFALNFDREDFGIRHKDTPFHRQGSHQVELMPARVEPEGAVVEVRLQAAGARSVRVRYRLPDHHKALEMDLVVDKTPVITAEAIYIPFAFALENPRFHLDLNGVPLEPEAEQLPGSCRDWYGIHRWAEVNDGDVSIVLVPMDAPLVQVGGIQTGRWQEHLEAHAAMLVSWPIHNHWDTNFKASQSEDILLRYRLTSRQGYDPVAATRFAVEQTPPLIVRAPGAEIGASGQFLQVTPGDAAEVHLKPAANGEGVILHVFNPDMEARPLSISFPTLTITTACLCSPIEDDGEPLNVEEGSVHLTAVPRSVVCARIVFNEF